VKAFTVATRGLDEEPFDGAPRATVAVISTAAGLVLQVRPLRRGRRSSVSFEMPLATVARQVIAEGTRKDR